MSHCRRLLLLLCFAAAASGQTVQPEAFARQTVQLLRFYPQSRGVNPGIVVLYEEAKTPFAAQIKEQIDRTPSTYRFNVTLAKVKKSTEVAPALASRPICVIGVDLSDKALRGAVRGAVGNNSRILTLSTSKAHLGDFAMAVVTEGTQTFTYRSDAELRRIGASFPAEVLALTRSVSTLDYTENYRQGIRAYEFKDWNALRQRMSDALDTPHADSNEQVIIYGLRIQRYLPHVYLGIAYAEQGRCTEARAAWSFYDNQRQLLERTTEAGLLDKYRSRCADTKEAATR